MQTVWWAGTLIGWAVFGAVVGVATVFLGEGTGVAGLLARAVGGLTGGLAVGGLSGLVLVRRRYRAWRYRFGPDALELERGIWWRTASAVPYQRIQQVEVEHGPIQRRLGLVQLSLRTASTSSLGSLPGIAEAEAGTIRSWLLRRAGADDGA